MLRLSGAAWSFVGATLDESAAIWRALGVAAMDLLLCPGALLSPEQIMEDPARAAARIEPLNILIPNVILLFASDFHSRALNHPDAAIRVRNKAEFSRIVEFCRYCGARSITVLPGVEHPSCSRDQSLVLAATALTELTEVAAAAGIGLSFEAHRESVLEDPREVRQFLAANPTLRLTLDYSHFVCGGFAVEDVHPLVPFAGHVHLRQAGRGALQARWDRGIIDFGDVVQRLECSGYEGFYCLEYEHDPWMGSDNVDVICESIKMRNAVRPIIAPTA